MKIWCEDHNIYWSAVKGGEYSKPGDPDLILCVDGRFVGVEAKTPMGDLEYTQNECAIDIKAAGGEYIVALSVEELEDNIRRLREKWKWESRSG